MKRTLVVFISLALAFQLLLSGCSVGKPDRNEELKDALNTAYDKLNETFTEESCDYELVSEFLESWAKNSKIEVEENTNHYTVLYNPPSKNCSKRKTTVIQCCIDTSDVQSGLNTLATGLACLLGPNRHGALKLIVTEIADGNRIGASSINSKYLKCDNFINLNRSNNYSVYVSGAETAAGIISSPVKTGKPEYRNAYEITMNIGEYADPYSFGKSNNYPNPITTIGELLATLKSSGRLFEIASFSSEANDGYLPYKATAVVVIDDNSVEGFAKKFEKSYGAVENRFDKLEDDFIYTMNETDMPARVLADSSADNLVSLMYTLKTGIYSQDEETGSIYSTSYIKSISADKRLEVALDMRAQSKEDLEIMSTDYGTTSGLCNAEYSSAEIHPVWSSDEGSKLASFFSGYVPLSDDDSNIMLKSSENDIFAEKMRDLNIITYSFNSNASKSVLRNITKYIESSGSKQLL